MIALAKAQTLFSQDESLADLAELLRRMIEPLADADRSRMDLQAATIMVDRRTADLFALVCGELAVNATKHGALAGDGHLAVQVVEAQGRIVLEWSETGIAGARPNRDGQGLAMMERIVATRGGTLQFDWRDVGLAARMVLPLARPGRTSA